MKFVKRRAKTGKFPGLDDMYIEVLKLIDEGHIDMLVDLCNLVYETGRILSDWLRSTFVTLP